MNSLKRNRRGLAGHGTGRAEANALCVPGDRDWAGTARDRIPQPISSIASSHVNDFTTPDGRYFVHQERLWRCTNPELDEETRRRLVGELMAARRGVATAQRAGDEAGVADARQRVHAAKVALGERGPTWWGDASDFNRQLVKDTPYAEWWQSRSES